MSTITYVGAGAAVSGVALALTPIAPAGLADGDTVLIQASIRNTPVGVVDTPDGWKLLAQSTGGSHRVFARRWSTGDTMPLLTLTGAVAGADTIARAFAFRGVSAEVLETVPAVASQNNSSAQNIAYPQLDVPGPNHVVIYSMWKQDDATSLGSFSGFTSVGTVIVTAGDDALQNSWYRIETLEVDISPGSITVTGGAAAMSSAIAMALKPEPSVAVIEQDVWPPRAQIVVTDLTPGDNVEIFRMVGGRSTPVRAGAVNGHSDPSLVVVDAEQPFGVPVHYVVYVNGIAYATPPATYTLSGGKVVLSDAITGQSAEVVIGAAGDREYSSDSARFRAGGRNLVVRGPMPDGAEGSYELLAESTSSVDGVKLLLRSATQGIVQIRQAGTTGADGHTYDGIDAYLAVDRFVERRWSQDGSDPRRLIVIEFAEVDGWAATLEARDFTYADVAAFFGPDATYADVADFFAPGATYLDAYTADWTP